MADNSIKILIEAQNKATKELNQVKKELEGLKKATKDTGTEGGKSVGGLLDQFKALKMGAVPYLAALGVAVGAFKKAMDFGKEGAQLEYASLKFERLADSAGTTADILLNDLKEATKGTRSEMELMAGAGDFMALGLAKSHDEVVRLTRVAGALGMNMNQLVLTLTNQTTMRFDALGVSVDGFEEKVNALKAAGMSASDAFKEAFLQQAEEQITKVGNAADTTMGTFQKLDAATKDLGDNLKKNLADLLAQDVIPALTQLIRTMNDNVVSAENSSRVMDEYKAAFEAGAITAEEYAAAQDKIRLAINYLQDPTELLIQMTKDLAVANDITGRAVDMTAENLIAQSIAAAQAKDGMSGIADATNSAEAAMRKYSEALLFSIASQGLSQTEAYNLAIAMGLVDEKTIYATEKMNLFKSMLDSGAISLETYNALVVGLNESLERLPEDVSVSVTMALKTDDLDRYLANLVRGITVPVYINGVGGGSGKVPEAAGGIVHAAAGAFGKQAYYVGEIGPEIFVPSQDGRILSNHESKAAIRSGFGSMNEQPIVININTPINLADRVWVENELAPYIRKGVQDVMARG